MVPVTETNLPTVGATYRSRRHPENVITVTAFAPDHVTHGKGGAEIRGLVSMSRVSDDRPGSLSLPMFVRAYEKD